MKKSVFTVIVLSFLTFKSISQDNSTIYNLIVIKVDSIIKYELVHEEFNLFVIDSIFNFKEKDCYYRCQNRFIESKCDNSIIIGNANEIKFENRKLILINFDSINSKLQEKSDRTFTNTYIIKLYSLKCIDNKTLQTQIIIYRSEQHPLIACLLIEKRKCKKFFESKIKWQITEVCLKNLI